MTRTRFSNGKKAMKRTKKPVKWNKDRIRQAFTFALLYGATDEQIAISMDVSVQTIDYWKRTKPEFREALQAGKDQADARVAEAFYKAACGYSHPDVDIRVVNGRIVKTKITKHYPPNAYAGNKWLTIRQREKWAEINNEIPSVVNLTQINLSGFTKEEKLLIEKLGMLEKYGDTEYLPSHND